MFAVVLKHVHGLKQIVDAAQDELTAGNQSVAVNSQLKRFVKAFDEFCRSESGGKEAIVDLKQQKDAIASAMEALLKNADGRGSDAVPVKQIMESSITYYEILEVYLDQYLDTVDVLVEYMEAPSDHQPKHIIRLHSDVRLLVQNAELVPVHACEMMVQILNLFGSHTTNGVAKNV